MTTTVTALPRVLAVVALAVFAAGTVAGPELGAMWTAHGGRVTGGSTWLAVAVAAGAVASRPQRAWVRLAIALGLYGIHVIGLVRTAGGDIDDSQVSELAAAAAVELAAMLIATQRWSPRALTMLALVAIGGWTVLGWFAPYATPLDAAGDGWGLFATGAVGGHLASIWDRAPKP